MPFFKPYIFFFHTPLSVRGRLQGSTIFKDRHHLHSHNSTNTCILASAHHRVFTIPFDDQIYIIKKFKKPASSLCEFYKASFFDKLKLKFKLATSYTVAVDVGCPLSVGIFLVLIGFPFSAFC